MTYSLRAKTKPSIEVRGARAPLGGGSNDAVSSDRIRATVSKLLARTLGDSVSRVASLAHGRGAVESRMASPLGTLAGVLVGRVTHRDHFLIP